MTPDLSTRDLRTGHHAPAATRGDRERGTAPTRPAPSPVSSGRRA
jgi:hypothetical protein